MKIMVAAIRENIVFGLKMKQHSTVIRRETNVISTKLFSALVAPDSSHLL